jgi:hypothetical protein
MDTKTLISDAKARFSFNSSKTYLNDKYTSKLIFADQNGLWNATTDLIAFLSSVSNDTVILLDSYQNPIKVDPKRLLDKTQSVYNQVMTDWYTEFEELKNTR